MGPMANARLIDAMDALLRDARARRDNRLRWRPHWQFRVLWAPTVVTDAPDDAALATSEIFGPILSIYRFTDLDDAIRRANATPVGLAAYAFAGSASGTRVLSRGLRAGMVGINTTHIASPPTPFGGVRDSGWGRSGGREGLVDCLDMKLVAYG